MHNGQYNSEHVFSILWVACKEHEEQVLTAQFKDVPKLTKNIWFENLKVCYKYFVDATAISDKHVTCLT